MTSYTGNQHYQSDDGTSAFGIYSQTRKRSIGAATYSCAKTMSCRATYKVTFGGERANSGWRTLKRYTASYQGRRLPPTRGSRNCRRNTGPRGFGQPITRYFGSRLTRGQATAICCKGGAYTNNFRHNWY